MSASTRAEARRRAILSRGNDRLAKLTSSARGEDAPAFVLDDQPTSASSTGLKAFIGEESDMPSLNVPVSTSASSSSPPSVDPSTWSEEQQKQFLQALMGASPASFRSRSPRPFSASEGRSASLPGNDIPSTAAPPASRKFMPLVHLITTWLLLGYMVVFQEPKAFDARTHGAITSGMWQRWADLGRANPDTSAFLGVQVVPFFWVFISLQIVLHFIRILFGYDALQHSGLFVLVLPHLPPAVSSVVVSGLKYLRMGSIFLDDVAGVVVGLGFVIWISGWFVNID